MNYPADFERVVGFDLVRSAILSRCRFPSSQLLVESWQMSIQFEEVLQRLDCIDELQRLNDECPSALEFQGSDITPFCENLGIENYMLDEESLSAILEIAKSYVNLSKAVIAKAEKMPLLAANLPFEESCNIVVIAIDKLLDDFGQVSPKASPQYAKISDEIVRLERTARQTMRGIFRDWKALGYTAETEVTVREDRLVIPVLAEYKRIVKGFVKDISATGKIFFVEPTQMLEMNNRLKELAADRKRERERILRQITAVLAPHKTALQRTMHHLSETDFLLAKWSWCMQENAQRPKVSATPQINLLNAVHPILRKELKFRKFSVIPLNMSLENRRIMVVSGPNAGGKSVVLKTVLLLQYMVQSGLFVTADAESRLGIFSFLGIDCGDGQTIEKGLSTFSAHLLHLKNLLNNANELSLIGIDEIGTGTDPRFGAPIAQVVLENLLEAGSFVIATTHFSQLREWGLDSAEVVQASMAYDVQEMKPLYNLVLGKPGSSFALELMRKSDFDTTWIDRIKALTGQQMVKSEGLMLHIEKQNQRLVQQLKMVDEKLEHLQNLSDSYHQLKETLQQKRNDYIQVARNDAKKILSETNKQIENTIRVIREQGAAKEVTQVARQKLTAYKRKIDLLGKDNNENGFRNAKTDLANQLAPMTAGVSQKKVHLKSPKLSKSNGIKNSIVHTLSVGEDDRSITTLTNTFDFVAPQPTVNLQILLPGIKVKSLVTGADGEVLDCKKGKACVAFGMIKM
ncbi:MAG: hypothetical protein O3B82_02375, partial [Bacteroidetes bacterium]|nr:hypothetical protein [Bacteroidota bacterium]